MASPNLTELVTTTLRDRQGELADNIMKSNALLSVLNERGQIDMVNGGRTIVRELEYAENATFMYYSGYETLNISPSDVFSAAEYSWRQAAVNVSWSGLEADVQNTGDAANIRLVAARIRNAETTMSNNISTGIYSDGTGTGGKQIDGLLSQVADAPTTGVVGGINRANFTFWRNQNVTLTSTDNATELVGDMRRAWISTSRGRDQTNLIVMGGTLYDLFWSDLQGIQRVTQANSGNRGFSALEWRGVPVLLDGGQAQGTGATDHGGGIAATRAYFLNTNYLFWSVHPNRNMTSLEERMSVNQDATVIPLVFAGNLTMSNAAVQAVIHE